MGTGRIQQGGKARPRNARGEGDRLRDEIIDASVKVLAVLAPDEPFSLRAVAREAKIAAPSIYIHFADMNALLLAVVEKLLKEQVAIRVDAEEKAAQAGGGAWERLLAWSTAAVAYGLKHPGHYKVLYEGRVLPRLNNPRLEELSRPLQQKAVELIRAIPVAKGAKRVCDDPQRLALLLWTGLHGLISLRINKPMLQWPDTMELAEQMTRAIIQPRIPPR
jgi:AcrR family transcriptional regulator